MLRIYLTNMCYGPDRFYPNVESALLDAAEMGFEAQVVDPFNETVATWSPIRGSDRL